MPESSCLNRPRLRKCHLGLLLAVVVAATGVGAAAASEAEAARTGVKAMTRNLYLGADLTPLILAPTRQEFRQRATETWNQVKRTNFPKRSNLIAKEVQVRRPDLIGLQEVSLWRRSPRGESDGDATPARRVRYDFLKILKRELRSRGERYRVVEVQRQADIEGPTSKNFDVRLTMRDAILVRRGADIDVRQTRGRNFDNNLVVPTAFGPVESTRGWTAADVRVDGGRFRFVNTHLEAFSAAVRAEQARELTRRRGALRTPKQTILVGDLNSDPNDTPDEAAAYRIIRGMGFSDSWIRTEGNRRGLTCCFNAEVNDRRPNFTSRIDHVLFRNGVRARNTIRVGRDQDNRTRSGLWPSDHAGTMGFLRVRAP
jgi:endonuclease/exonuclease/phosphatase family metal-dependent hydrolase